MRKVEFYLTVWTSANPRLPTGSNMLASFTDVIGIDFYTVDLFSSPFPPPLQLLISY